MKKTINCLLVDDEYLALNLLENHVKKVSSLHLLAKTKSPVEAIEIMANNKVDILFSDIQMPAMSGINMMKTLIHRPVTIFTTAYSEYATEAYDLDVVDYLVKPISFERFLQSVQKAQNLLMNREEPKSPVQPVDEMAKSYLTIKVNSQLVKLSIDSICFIEGLKEYVRFVCEDDKTYVTLASLKSIMNELEPKGFMRVHKSFIVNTEKVNSLEGNLLHIGEYRIPISREGKPEVLKRIFE